MRRLSRSARISAPPGAMPTPRMLTCAVPVGHGRIEQPWRTLSQPLRVVPPPVPPVDPPAPAAPTPTGTGSPGDLAAGLAQLAVSPSQAEAHHKDDSLAPTTVRCWQRVGTFHCA